MFEIISKSGNARTGILHTAHGKIKTPFFMPVATKGATKFLSIRDLREIKTDCIISNSLLLYQKPGLEVIRKSGGLHKFYNWKKGIFTDSGGFQTLNDFFNQKNTHEGAMFTSPNQTKELITPEKAMEIQQALGSDVAMCLDDVPKHDDPLQAVRSKTLLTHSWAKRCKEYHDKHKTKQLLFGIAQGGMYKDIRKKSMEYIKNLDFDGIALGGLAIGEPISTMFEMIKSTIKHAPKDKPRYLMGVGSPEDIIKCISLGVDIFDSIFPAMNARHGTLFRDSGHLKLKKKEYRNDQNPIDSECDCYVCRHHSRAYVRHLLIEGHSVGKQLATYHNIFYMQKMIEKCRQDIEEGKTI